MTKEEFKKEVLESDKPVVVDFFATWCGPCRMQLPIVEQFGEERKDVKVVKINVDENHELASEYGVMSIPNILVFKNGEMVHNVVGLQSKDRLAELVE